MHICGPSTVQEQSTLSSFATYAVVKLRSPENPMNPVLNPEPNPPTGLQMHPRVCRIGWFMISPRNASVVIVVASDILYLSLGVLMRITGLEDKGGTLGLLVTTIA
jgi:hypothetical protein